jgi:hypothetical protein
MSIEKSTPQPREITPLQRLSYIVFITLACGGVAVLDKFLSGEPNPDPSALIIKIERAIPR